MSLEKLLDKRIFGNEAGGDESPDMLKEYFIFKDEFEDFFDSQNKFMCVRSKKGMGKSTLLQMSRYKSETQDNVFTSIFIEGHELETNGDFSNLNPNKYISIWQQRICSHINNEISNNIGFTFDQDEKDIMTNSEIQGFKKRNFFESLLKRFEFKVKGNSISLNDQINANNKSLLERISKKKSRLIWVFIDDIDATFLNQSKDKLIVSTFYSACRYLVRDIEGLVLRVSSRTNVWTIIKHFDEALDKCEQYMIDILWEKNDFKLLIRNKIYAYIKINYPHKIKNIGKHDDEVLKFVFKHPFMLNIKDIRKVQELGGSDKLLKKLNSMHGRMYHSFSVLKRTLEERLTESELKIYGDIALRNFHNKPVVLIRGKYGFLENNLFEFSNRRPRWAVQLCYLSAKNAKKRQVLKIASIDIDQALPEFSKIRLADLYKEHNHQFDKLQNLIESFNYVNSKFYTHSLADYLKKNFVSKHGMPKIDGIEAERLIDIIEFLYRIDFIQKVEFQNDDNNTNRYIYFEKSPNEVSKIQYQENNSFCWSINKTYHHALNVKKNSKIQ
ncbi:hypothetical protein KORDIASMS9_00653 [Kordia sp. SMS9]|uniref:P-loop ATPase, Sll1717 family n=1 Tax=Kordia sp. SMS9 TaxID=2282170 RepID=UPI000E0D094F|nr:hypothetical protein [Kordia sp. SMS9]AXG68438.1 hypothetical protein KORDIASMS9_00653 [Kordia sp. SMS9]